MLVDCEAESDVDCESLDLESESLESDPLLLLADEFQLCDGDP